jgi:phospholipase C
MRRKGRVGGGVAASKGFASSVGKVVIVLQENHTFDNYFGSRAGVDGTAGKGLCIPQSPGSSKCVAPYHDTSRTPVDMNHNWPAAHKDYDGGKMDGFVYSEGSPETVGYYDGSDLPRYWKAADQYVLCDRYFTSVMSESAPNHLYLVAGTAGGLKDDRVPSSLILEPVFKQLDEKGVTWKVYGSTSWYRSFAYVQGSQGARGNFAPGSEFSKDVKSGSLSDVSWVIGAPGGDEHPPADIQTGEGSVADDVVNAVGASRYWPSSAVFVTWDDYGGFYDHVPPPQVDEWGYGFRVPCLVVSPYAKEGFVDSTVNDHTSILKFVESRFGLSPLSTRDAAANDMAEAFDFTRKPRAFEPI